MSSLSFLRLQIGLLVAGLLCELGTRAWLGTVKSELPMRPGFWGQGLPA